MVKRTVSVNQLLRVLGSSLMICAMAGFISGCASSAKRPSTVTVDATGAREGQWRGKMLVTDKKTNKSNTIIIDAYAHEPSQMRLEVTTQLGIYIASVVLNGDELSYLLPRQKRFVQTKATAESLARLVNIPLDPKVLLELLFDDAPKNEGWVCDGEPKPASCQNEKEDMTVSWDERASSRRILHFVSKRGDGRLSLEEARTKVEFKNALFELSPPKGYKVEKAD